MPTLACGSDPVRLGVVQEDGRGGSSRSTGRHDLWIRDVVSGAAARTGHLPVCGAALLRFFRYTDMALGIARCFGINLTQNFNNPYAARSIAEFWRRWHISFSRWIFDYIFNPLQFALRDLRVAATVIALIVTFVVSGVWHGVGWTFLIWGLLHGIYMCVSISTRSVRKRWHARIWRGRQGSGGPGRFW